MTNFLNNDHNNNNDSSDDNSSQNSEVLSCNSSDFNQGILE